MGETNISWTRYTLNTWMGCTRRSPACDFCYAADLVGKKFKDVQWGEPGTKAVHRHTAQSTWDNAHMWNRRAIREGHMSTVFLGSLMDVWDPDVPLAWTHEMCAVIEQTPHLLYLMLSKLPQNARDRVPARWNVYGWPKNIWAGATAENQKEYDRRRPHLMDIPTSGHFFSMEPLLGRIELGDGPHADWYIVGGESGPQRRAMSMDWVEQLRFQVTNRGKLFHFKQDNGLKPGVKGRAPPGLWACKDVPPMATIARPAPIAPPLPMPDPQRSML